MRLVGLAVALALNLILVPSFVSEAQKAGAYRHYTRIIRASFRRLVALGVIISMTLTGCASGPYYVVPDLRDRATQIPSIAVVPVDVRVFRAGLRGEEFSDEWSETA